MKNNHRMNKPRPKRRANYSTTLNLIYKVICTNKKVEVLTMKSQFTAISAKCSTVSRQNRVSAKDSVITVVERKMSALFYI
jgi:hypothetical protein